MMDMGKAVFVQSDDKNTDGFASLKERVESIEEIKEAEKKKDDQKFAETACRTWIDVRSFGQVFAFKGVDVSVGVRGPVSIHPAFSVSPVELTSLQITKSVNSVPGAKKSSDTMGMKHRVDFGVYVTYGSINCQLAEKTGFTVEDAEVIKESLKTLFENDASSARPEGSMAVVKLYWWKHNSKTGQYSSAKVHRTLHVVPEKEVPKNIEDYKIYHDELPGLTPEIYDEY